MTTSSSTPVADLIADARERGEPIVLDGALGTELEARGCDLDDPLWSARVLADTPGIVEDVHRDYFAAGAQVATTASYQAAPLSLAARGLGEADAVALIGRSVEVADAARRTRAVAGEAGRPLLIAGSVGPYGAHLADGSEYRGDYALSPGELAGFHRVRIEALADSGADLIACETIPQFAEARALLELVEAAGIPAWFSFTLRDDAHLSDGTPLAAVAELLDASPQVVAVGVNCVPLEQVAPALTALAAHTSKPLLAYPNSGEIYDGATRTWHAAPSGSTLAEQAHTWAGLGAALIGGCCRTTPPDIGALARAVRRR
ncbi:MAG: homocysteine S-methyltransferase [Propioniciclava sp.]|uniref:homocysteine S-methyltransferase n=1 Tax=Propioniciclava sp. TaxID=2038686 RepID=UPI0039E449CE